MSKLVSIEEFCSENRKSTLEKFEKYKGQLVMIDSSDCRVERLVAVGENRYDYLYITFDEGTEKVMSYTILDRLIPLKGFIREDDYDRLSRKYSCDKNVAIYIIKKKLHKSITLLSEIYLDI